MIDRVIGYVKDIWYETRNKHDLEVALEERKVGLRVLIESLFENNIKEENIIQTVQKHYDLKLSEITKEMSYVKNVCIPVNNLGRYMVSDLGYSFEKAREWIITNGVEEKISENINLSQLTSKELWKKFNM